MARYKKTGSITLSEKNYPEAVRRANKVARMMNRPVHEVVSEYLARLNLRENANPSAGIAQINNSENESQG